MYIIYTNIICNIHDAYKNSLIDIQCAHRVTVTRVGRVATEEHVGGNYIQYIAYKC